MLERKSTYAVFNPNKAPITSCGKPFASCRKAAGSRQEQHIETTSEWLPRCRVLVWVHAPFIDRNIAIHSFRNGAENDRAVVTRATNWVDGGPNQVAARVAFQCTDQVAFITGSADDIGGGVIALR